MKNILLLFSFTMSICLTTGVIAQVGPSCTHLNIPVGQDDSATIMVASHIPNAADAAPFNLSLKNPYGGIIAVVNGADETTEIRIAACSYLGRTLTLNASNDEGGCWSEITLKQGNAPTILGRSTTVFCTDPLVQGGHIGDTLPDAMIPCLPDGKASFVADWVRPVDCVLGMDTAKVIYREYEAFGKDGARGTAFDTIHVFRLPQITPTNTYCVEKDTTYCGALLGSRFGPYMLAENPTTQMCDTVYFLNPDGTAAEIDAKCGLSIGVKVEEFGGECEELTKYTVLLKQSCYGTPSTACMLPPSIGLEMVSEGYWECVFWHVDLDTFPPVVACEMDTITVPTGSHDCAAHITLPPVTVTDSCNDVKLVKAIIEGVGTFPLTKSGDQWVASGTVKLPHYEGYVPVIYEAYDDCHNLGMDTCYIRVKDLTKPVAVCDKGINVSLTDKKIWVKAETFDEGSWDNCGVNMLLARRTDWQEACVDLCDSLIVLDYSDYHDTLCTPYLSSDKFADPVEAHYKKTLDWLQNDGQDCSNLMYQAWRYGLMEYATTVCKGVDQHSFVELARDAIDPSVEFDQVQQIGGGWSDEVPFSCEDACGPVQVEVLVMDYWCNWSRCWTDVWVEDKTPVRVDKDVVDFDMNCETYRRTNFMLGGSLTSLEDIVNAAEAGDAAAYEALDEAFGGYRKAWQDSYGNYVDIDGEELECEITFNDSICECVDVPGFKEVYSDHFGWETVPYTSRECGYTAVERDLSHGVIVVNCAENVQCTQEVWSSFDHCGQGVIYRKFKIWQGCPESTSGHIPDTISRIQKIWIGNECELDIGMFDLPEDAEVESCGIEYDPDGSGNVVGVAHPDSVGTPEYTFDDDCRLVGIGHYDKVFKIVGGDAGCYKIIRTWCFADWCQIDKPISDAWLADPTYEGIVLKHVQKIILTDTVAPLITISPIGTDGVVAAGGCAFNLETSADVADACGVLEFEWALLDDKGNIVAEDNGSLDLSVGSSFNIAVEDLGTGSYDLKAIVTDACQNEGIASMPFEITTEKKPAVICLSSITAELTPMDLDNDAMIDTGMAVIWAKEYQIGSSAPACDDDSLAYYIEFIDGVNDDTIDPEDADSLAIDCSHQPGPGMIRIWVKSFPSETFDYCDVELIIQDNMGACGDISSTTGIVGGLIQTELEEHVEQVQVEASLSNGTVLDFLTEGTGAYNFATALGTAVEIRPKKDTDPMNGVSTADLVRIQKHILGKSLLDTEYRFMAADVNNDQRISALDLLELRRLILGKIDKFENSDSWVFANKIDGNASYTINNMQQAMAVNFVGIKVGDVNSSANAAAGSGRSGKSLVLQTEDVEMIAGSSYKMDFKTSDFRDIEGYQFTLNFDPSSMVLADISVEESVLELTEENFGLTHLDRGLITTSWDNFEGVDLNDETIFTLTFTALTEARLSDVVTINSKVTRAEAYNADNDLLDVSLQFTNGVQNGSFALYQNRPNPFKDATNIGFDLPEAMPAILTIYDVTGKVVKVVEGEYSKGYNEIAIDRNDFKVAGVLYYQLDSETYTATRKMVVID